MAVVDPQVVPPQGDFGEAVANPGGAAFVAVAGGAFGDPVFAEIAVFLGLDDERGPGQFQQQYVVEPAQHRFVVGNQVVVAVEVGEQLVEPLAGRGVQVPVLVLAHVAQFLQPLQAPLEHVARRGRRQRCQPVAQAFEAFASDPHGIGIQLVQQLVELGDRDRAQRSARALRGVREGQRERFVGWRR